MTHSLLADAFGHHTWATLRLIEACERLSDEQLATTVPGTFGSILDTMRHLVGADSWYLHRLGGQRFTPIEEEDQAAMDMAAMRVAMQRQAAAWPDILAADPDPAEIIEVRRDDGSRFGAPKGIRLAQVVHHGTDHRSQICTALTVLGVEPPAIDLWDYGAAEGLTKEIPSSG